MNQMKIYAKFLDVSLCYESLSGSGANKVISSAIKVLLAREAVSLKMLCHGETNQMFKTSHILYWTLIFCNIFFQLSITLSVPNVDFNSSATMVTNNTGNNSINDDLYVIKAIVYEIGILTDADNAANDTTERQEEVKLSFYNSPTNSSES